MIQEPAQKISMSASMTAKGLISDVEMSTYVRKSIYLSVKCTYILSCCECLSLFVMSRLIVSHKLLSTIQVRSHVMALLALQYVAAINVVVF